MAEVTLDAVRKVYPNGYEAIHGLDLQVKDTEFLVLVGPSGCGKSTALRMIAGLEDISSGEMKIGDRVVNDLEPKDRDIAMVFQNYALYPHMTVRDNIGFSLKLAKTRRAELNERVEHAARILELTDLLDRKPGQLSGGQRQRVAMGRAIVRQPAAFLMDEPLSNLDAKLRVQMRAEISRLQRDLAVTTVYVTHDQVEAMTMGDRVAVLKDGHLQQVDTPQKLYDRPDNVFVAAFIGSPSMNLFEATIDNSAVVIGPNRFELPASVLAGRPRLSALNGNPVIVGIRPEDLEDEAFATADFETDVFDSEVVLTEALGSELIVHCTFDAVRVDAGDPDTVEEIGEQTLTVGRFDPRSTAREGQPIRVAVNLEKLHFFDAADRKGIWA